MGSIPTRPTDSHTIDENTCFLQETSCEFDIPLPPHTFAHNPRIHIFLRANLVWVNFPQIHSQPTTPHASWPYLVISSERRSV